MIQRLTVMESWANIIGTGTIGNLIDTIADGEAEIARYLEYLYQEKKWRNARNMSSLTHQTDLISYKRQLPKSAIGYVVVSHSDINGIQRLPNYGISFFDLDQTSDFDDLVQNASATYEEKDALVPWTADENYSIPIGTEFKTGAGIPFISFQTIESRALKEPYSAILASEIKKADFIRAGGWNGIKYLKVPVIQGEINTVEFGYAKGTKFESFTINAINVENASNIISEQFFKVRVIPILLINGVQSVEAEEQWEKIENIRLAGPYDKVFEIKILNNEDQVLIKFGDGITGQRLPENSRVAVDYLETMGLSGNIDQRFQINQMILPPGHNQIDPRTNTQASFLQCTNIVPIMGGKDIEDENEIRVNAPPSYLQSYSIATKASYYEQILKNSPINLLHCKLFQSGVYDLESYGKGNSIEFESILENSVLQEIHASKNSLLITAIRSNGTKIEDPQNELIEPLIKLFEENSSPNDSFDYIEPNYIEIRPNIIINTSETLTEQEIIDEVKPEVVNRYSIFNTDFNKPYFKTDITDIVQGFSFTKYSNIFLEAKTEASLKPTILSLEQESRDVVLKADTLLAFPFSFDSVFAQDKLNVGFKNYRYKSPYLIRADLLFKDATKSKSLFLFDNRIDLQNEVRLMDAELLPINANIQVPTNRSIQYSNFQEPINFQEAYSDYFYNQQVRTAQFKYIERITSESYIYQMKKFSIEPYEIRPLLVDENGKIKQFPKSDVPSDLQISLNLQKENIVSNNCYWENTLFVPNCKIIFSEDYSNPNAETYANGYIIIPLVSVLSIEQDRTNLYNMLNNINDFATIAEYIERLLKDQLTINIYSMPVMDEFECEYPFDIIFSASSNILVQKNFLAAK
jgi:hypothetical protein